MDAVQVSCDCPPANRVPVEPHRLQLTCGNHPMLDLGQLRDRGGWLIFVAVYATSIDHPDRVAADALRV